LGSQFDRRGPVIEFWTVPNDGRLATGDWRLATGDWRLATGDGRRATEPGCYSRRSGLGRGRRFPPESL